MKQARRLLFCLLLICVFFAFCRTEVNANDTGFSTDPLSEKSQKEFFNNLQFAKLKEEPTKEAIRCFDVNKNGYIAVGCHVFNSATISVYDSYGTFIYGFSFKEYGDFGVLFSDECLNICFVRGDLVLTVNSEGELIEMAEIRNTDENRHYWTNSVFVNRRSNNDTEYLLKNNKGFFNLFSTKYTQLEVKTSDGEKTVIYDVNSKQLFFDILVFVVVIGMIAIAAWRIPIEFIKARKKQKDRLFE